MDDARALMRAHPDPPTRNILERILRRLAREALWGFIKLLEAGHRFGRFLLRTEYKVEGGCKKRGACCQHILVEWSGWLDRFPWFGRLVLFKLTRIYSFYDKGYTWEVQDGLLVRVLGCHALEADGSCGEYRLRPLFCRTYPEVPLTGRPMVLKGCGYRFTRRDGAAEPTTSGDPAAPSDLVQIGRSIRPGLQTKRIQKQPKT